MAGRSDNLDNLVRQVVNHPSFQDAVNSVNQRVNESSVSGETSTSSVNEFESEPSSALLEVVTPRASASYVNNQNSENGARRTPREDFQSLFRRAGPSFQQSTNVPQFQRRTNWGPSPSSRSQRSRSGSTGKPYSSNSSKGKNSLKKTFARKVVLLRRPSDSMVRGGAKVELQRLGHVLSYFQFDKFWSADEIHEKPTRGIQETFDRY